VENQERQYIGPRSAQRFPAFASIDLQVQKGSGFR